MWVFENGGLERVSEFSLKLNSYYEGGYITWPKITELYQNWEPEIRESFNSDHNDIELVEVN